MQTQDNALASADMAPSPLTPVAEANQPEHGPRRVNSDLKEAVITLNASEETPLGRHECNALLPAMTSKQFEALKADIRENGLQVPIVLCGGKILDGWHRYQICRDLGIEPLFEHFSGEHPILGCVSLNIARRHLEKGQLAVLANEMTAAMLSEPEAQGGTVGKPDAGDNIVTLVPAHGGQELPPLAQSGDRQGRARSHLARVLKVSEGYISKAKALKEKAPELYGKVGAGELTLSQAQKTATRRESQPEAGAEKQIPAVRCQIEGLVTRIHRLLESTPDKKQAYEALQPLLQWAKTFEEQQGEEQAAPAGGPESRLPFLTAANA